MVRILQSEARKFFSLTLWWLALVLTPLGAVALTAVLILAVSMTSRSPLNLDSAEHLLAATNLMGSLGYVIPLALGVLIYTGDVSHRTLALTLVGEPSRLLVYAAKLIIAAVYGAVLGALTALGGLLGGLFVSSAGGDAFTLLPLVAGPQFLLVCTFAIWAVLGVGLGALVRSSLVAIVGVLVLTQLVEPLLRLMLSAQITGGPVPVLPGMANDAAIGGSLMALAMGGTTASIGAGMVVLAGYAVVVVAAGGVRAARYELV